MTESQPHDDSSQQKSFMKEYKFVIVLFATIVGIYCCLPTTYVFGSLICNPWGCPPLLPLPAPTRPFETSELLVETDDLPEGWRSGSQIYVKDDTGEAADERVHRYITRSSGDDPVSGWVWIYRYSTKHPYYSNMKSSSVFGGSDWVDPPSAVRYESSYADNQRIECRSARNYEHDTFSRCSYFARYSEYTLVMEFDFKDIATPSSIPDELLVETKLVIEAQEARIREYLER